MKHRLRQMDRDRLVKLAEAKVQPKKEWKALRKAYDRAVPLVRKLVEAKCPPADMSVLTRYGKSAGRDYVLVQLGDGAVRGFNFDKETGPQLPGPAYSTICFRADDARTIAAVQAWAAVQDAYDAERKSRLAAYSALIAGAKTFEDVAEVWPEAEELRTRVCGDRNVPTLLTSDLASTINTDLRERVAA